RRLGFLSVGHDRSPCCSMGIISRSHRTSRGNPTRPTQCCEDVIRRLNSRCFSRYNCGFPLPQFALDSMLLPEQSRKSVRRPPPLPVPVKPPSNVARIVIVAVVASVFVLSGLIGGLVIVVRTIDRVVQDANSQSSTIDAPPTLRLP